MPLSRISGSGSALSPFQALFLPWPRRHFHFRPCDYDLSITPEPEHYALSFIENTERFIFGFHSQIAHSKTQALPNIDAAFPLANPS